MSQLDRFIFEHLPTGKVVVDSDLNILLANAEARRHFAEALSLPDASDAVEGSRLLQADEALAQAARQALGVARKFSARPSFLKNAREDRCIESVYDLRALPPLQDAKRLLLIEIRHDHKAVSAIKDLNADRRRERQAALRERRNARELTMLNQDLQRFAHAAAHDMREPVRIVSTLSDALLNHGGELSDERRAKFLDRIHRHALRAQTIVDDIMAFSSIRHSALQCEPVDLAALINEVWLDRSATSMAQTPPHLSLDLPQTVWCDPSMMAIVFRNLVQNAFKFHGGRPVRVEVTSEEIDRCEQICFRDHGEGFDDAKSAEIFEPFKRLHSKDEVEGSGIGLATCRQVINRHDGKIWAQGTPGEGAAFFIRLPLPPRKAEQSPANSEISPAALAN